MCSILLQNEDLSRAEKKKRKREEYERWKETVLNSKGSQTQTNFITLIK
jgi:hypothetical protein